jgi:hypothetical protein
MCTLYLPRWEPGIRALWVRKSHSFDAASSQEARQSGARGEPAVRARLSPSLTLPLAPAPLRSPPDPPRPPGFRWSRRPILPAGELGETRCHSTRPPAHLMTPIFPACSTTATADGWVRFAAGVLATGTVGNSSGPLLRKLKFYSRDLLGTHLICDRDPSRRNYTCDTCAGTYGK